MTALAALCGAGVGFGVVLLAGGLRGVEPAARPPRVAVATRLEGMTLRLALGVGAGVMMALLTGWPVGALLVAGLGFAGPSLFHSASAQRAAVARSEAVAGWAEMLRDTMAGAAGIEQAITATAAVAPAPIREEVQALAIRLERERLAPALRAFAASVADPTCDLVVAALVLASEKQARRLGELLGTLAASARDQASMRLRVEAGRARTRTAVRVITFTTLGFALSLVVLNRGYLEAYDSAVGQLVLAVVGSCFGAGLYWLGSMARAGTPERFLAAETAGGNEGGLP